MNTKLVAFWLRCALLLLGWGLIAGGVQGQQLASQNQVTDSNLAKIEELLTEFSANCRSIDRYAVAVHTTGVSIADHGDSTFSERWNLFCYDGESDSRRIDEISPTIDFQSYRPLMFARTLIYKKHDVVGLAYRGSVMGLNLDDEPHRNENGLPFHRFDPWQVSLGHRPYNTANVRWKSGMSDKMQTKFSASKVISFSENLRNYTVRFSWTEKPKVEMEFVFDHESLMPVRADTIFAGQGLLESTSTVWQKAELDGETWVPKEVIINSVVPPIAKPSKKIESRLEFFWLQTADFPDSVFDSTADGFVSTSEMKDRILESVLEGESARKRK